MTARRPYVPTPRDRAKDAEAATYGVRHGDWPVPGLFAWRFRKGAVEVAARLLHEPSRDPVTHQRLERSWYWSATIDGKPDLNPSPSPSDTIWNIYIFGRRIGRAEYDYLLADRAWNRKHRPGSPEAEPRKAVNFATMDLPF